MRLGPGPQTPRNYFALSSAALPAATRAIGTRNGLQETYLRPARSFDAPAGLIRETAGGARSALLRCAPPGTPKPCSLRCAALRAAGLASPGSLHLLLPRQSWILRHLGAATRSRPQPRRAPRAIVVDRCVDACSRMFVPCPTNQPGAARDSYRLTNPATRPPSTFNSSSVVCADWLEK